jgi:penicillin-binding protein 2
MRGVMTEPGGTGGKFGRDVVYPVAAKTGTVQVYNFSAKGLSDSNQEALPFNIRDNSWFIAFAPADNPKIAVAVIMEHSKLASFVARKVMDYYILQALKMNYGPQNQLNATPLQMPLENTNTNERTD